MPKQGKTPKKKSKEKTPQKSEESEYPAMEQEELKRLVQNAIEQSQAQLQQKHEEQIKRLEADREALEERLTRKFEDQQTTLRSAQQMEKDIQAQTPLAVKFKLQPGDSRYVRYVEENHHESLRKKSFNPNYHPNELKYLRYSPAWEEICCLWSLSLVTWILPVNRLSWYIL